VRRVRVSDLYVYTALISMQHFLIYVYYYYIVVSVCLCVSCIAVYCRIANTVI